MVDEPGSKKEAGRLQWIGQGLPLPEMLHIKQDFTVNEEVACVFVKFFLLQPLTPPWLSWPWLFADQESNG